MVALKAESRRHAGTNTYNGTDTPTSTHHKMHVEPEELENVPALHRLHVEESTAPSSTNETSKMLTSSVNSFAGFTGLVTVMTV